MKILEAILQSPPKMAGRKAGVLQNTHSPGS